MTRNKASMDIISTKTMLEAEASRPKDPWLSVPISR